MGPVRDPRTPYRTPAPPEPARRAERLRALDRSLWLVKLLALAWAAVRLVQSAAHGRLLEAAAMIVVVAVTARWMRSPKARARPAGATSNVRGL